MPWPITRTQPLPPCEGIAIPCFIRNMEYHLTTLDVYTDGAIDVSGFVDRALFDGKVRQRWGVGSAPDGAIIRLYNLGRFTAAHGDWMRDDLRPEVDAYLQGRSNLLDMQGVAWEQRGNVRYAKMMLGDGRPVRHPQIPAERVSVFHMQRLTSIFVFADGQARIGTDGELLTLDELPRMFQSGELQTEVADGTRIRIDDLGSVVCEGGIWPTRPFELMAEILDVQRRLSGEPSVVAQCAARFEAWQMDPSRENLTRLKAAYEAVPKHLRPYCGDMDDRDGPIREALRSWSL